MEGTTGGRYPGDDGSTGGDAGEWSVPDVVDFGAPAPTIVPTPGPGAGTPSGDVLAAPPRRSRRPLVLVLAGALAVLLVGGVAFGMTLLHRPDVTLKRALDATLAEPGMDVSLVLPATDSSTAQLGSMSLELALTSTDPSNPELGVTLTVQGKTAMQVVVVDRTLYLTCDVRLVAGLSPALAGTVDSFNRSLAAGTFPPDAEKALRGFLSGTPVALEFPSSSAAGKAYDQMVAQLGVTPQARAKVSAAWDALVAAVPTAVSRNGTIERVGSDSAGDHLRVTVPSGPLVAALAPKLRDYAAAVAALGGKTAAAPTLPTGSVPNVPLELDVWVRDGRVAAVEMDVAALARDLAGTDGAAITGLGPAATLRAELHYPAKVSAPAGALMVSPDTLAAMGQVFASMGAHAAGLGAPGGLSG